MFYSLHNHSDASNIRTIDALCKVDELVDRAIELGYDGVALTDHESISNYVQLSKAEDRIKKEHPNFKVIRGNEIYLVAPEEVGPDTKIYNHFILNCLDAKGFMQIKEASSRAWGRAYKARGKQRVPTTYKDLEEIVMPNQGHIIASSACLGGELPRAILAGDGQRAHHFIDWCLKVFGEKNFFLELQPGLSPEQIFVNQTLVTISRKMGIPFIVTTDTHYLKKEDFDIHQAFLRSKGDPDRETESFYRYCYMFDKAEIVSNLVQGGLSEEDAKKAMENTALIGERVKPFEYRCGTHVPQTPIPDFTFQGIFEPYKKEYPAIGLFLDSPSKQDQYLMKLLEDGIIEKKIQLTPERLDRINSELSVINTVSVGLTKAAEGGEEQHVSSYFLLMHQVIDIARQYSFVGAGRGSSSGFYLCYLLDLVEVDALHYNLPSWRFLNDVRLELPDIDTDVSGTKKGEIMAALRRFYGDDNVLNCATFKTETLKAAVLTAMRGLGYSNDEANALASEIPVNRGHVYTLKECEEGDTELEYEPAPAFIEHLKSYNGLYETVKKIEGVRLNASIHASAVYIFDHSYLEHNSLMRAPNGVRITAFDMDDTNAMSGLKIDLLFTDAQTKLMKCMELLLNAHQITWQGSLYATYKKYLHPDVLDYTTPKLWENMSNGVYDNIFQWDTAEGAVAIKKAQPRSIIELATINSTIRVQADDGGVPPIDRYIAFKDNQQLWYDEMAKAGLNQGEIELMKHYLLPAHGVSMQQEDFMRLSMDPKIAGFSMAQANKLRKVIAHKQLAELKNQKELFFSCCKRQGTSEALQNYVWDYCIQPLAKYSFSIIHATAYSIVALQEVNLAYHYNPLYWACACLSVNSGNADSSYEVDDGEEDAESDDGKDDDLDEAPQNPQKRKIAPDYGKIAKAVSKAKKHGIVVGLPDINSACDNFLPDVDNNQILYSLTTVNAVSADLYKSIVRHRPYSSLADFAQRVEATPAQVVGLIKAGCFDKLERKDRKQIMKDYLIMLSIISVPDLNKPVSLVNIKKAIKDGMDLSDKKGLVQILSFKCWVSKFQEDPDSNRRLLLTDKDAVAFFQNHFADRLNLAKGDYDIVNGNKILIKVSTFTRVYNLLIAPLKDYFATKEGQDRYLKFERICFCRNMWGKYCTGAVASWEMEQLCMYHGKHELASLDKIRYGVVNFDSLPEKPIVTGHYEKNGKVYDIFDIVAVAGTVINANNTKHIVSLLTTDGVVDVKMYQDLYNRYREKISTVINGEKKVIDEPWLKRGKKLLVYGVRRDNMFVVRGKMVNGARRDVGLIEAVYPDGSADIRYSRRHSKEGEEE